MDSYGLLAAWIGINSFLFAVIISAAVCMLQTPVQHWWALTSKERSERRLKRLMTEWGNRGEPDNTAIYEITVLYGSLVVNAVVSVGLIMISIEILDLGPAILASTLPFSVNAKILTHTTGLLMLVLSYFFIVRMAYLGIKLRAAKSRRQSGARAKFHHQVSQLQERLARESTIETTHSESIRSEQR